MRRYFKMNKQIELTESQEKEFFNKIKNEIIDRLEKMHYTGDLGDLGNEIGIAVGEQTCKDGKDLNIWSFEKNSFICGFEHGYSLKDGSH